MVEVRRGGVYWVAPDEARGSVPPIAHPYVVVQDDVFNRSRVRTVVVMGLTSNLSRAAEPGNVLLDPGEGGLTARSVAVVSQVTSVDREQIGAQLGALSDARVDQLVEGLRFQQRAFLRGR